MKYIIKYIDVTGLSILSSTIVKIVIDNIYK